MSELKACPFCSVTPRIFKSYSKTTIFCINEDCNVKPTFTSPKRESPIQKWNTRATDDQIEKLQSENAQMKDAIREVIDGEIARKFMMFTVINLEELLERLK